MPAHASPVNNVTHHTTSSLPSNGNSERNPARTRLAQRDHDWVVGEVVAVHHRPEAFDERRMLDARHARAAVYYGRSTFEALGSGERAEHLPSV